MRTPSRLITVVAAIVLLSSCRSVPITPAAVREAGKVPAEETVLLVRHWEEAVVIANAFLASPYRRTLPPGQFTLADDGMTFHSDAIHWPVHVRCDAIGNLCAKFGFVGQERTDGFAVGRVRPHRDTVADNTFFRTRTGEMQRPEAIAALLLHETTHQVLRDGTVNIPKAAAYYAEAVLLLRYRTLTAERRPYATSEEFNRFLESHGQDPATQQRLLAEFEGHLAQGPSKWCRHGPFEVPLPPAVSGNP